MNTCRLIKREFKFLKEYGFKNKVYSKNCDYEVLYSKNGIGIEIDYYLGNISGKFTNVNESLANSNYIVNLVITHNNIRENIFHCSLFDGGALEKLTSELNKIDTSNTELILNIYASFVKNNIENLIMRND